MASSNVIKVTSPNDAHPSALCMIDATIEVIDFEQHHVAAVSASTLKEATGSRSLGVRRYDFDELVAHDHQRIDQTELSDPWVVEADAQAERLAEVVNHGVEVVCNQRHLSQSDHLLMVPIGFASLRSGRAGQDRESNHVEEGT